METEQKKGALCKKQPFRKLTKEEEEEWLRISKYMFTEGVELYKKMGILCIAHKE